MAAAACEQPTIPIIPAKHDIGRRQRHRIVRQTRAYAAAMSAYVACIKRGLAAAGGEGAPDLRHKLLTRRYATAVREFDAVLTLFTERIGSLDTLRTGRAVSTAQRACISMGTTGKTLALDDDTVLFYPPTGRIFINRLPRQCPGLRSSGGSFQHTTARGSLFISEMCRGDTVTLIKGNHAGFTCRLGPFRELTKAQAAALFRDRTQPDDGTVTVSPAQLPPDEDSGAGPAKHGGP